MKSPRFAYARHRHGTPDRTVAALELEKVTAYYPYAERPALLNVSFDIAPGTRVALTGPNGAGKSTLLKAAAGLIPLASGSIRVHGAKVGGCCHRVGYLSQRGDLDWRFPITLRRLVLTGRYAHLGWFARPAVNDQQIVDQTLQRLQIADLADRPINALSGGQQQRALLARAIVQEADTLLLDEPTSAIDVQTRVIVRDVLRELAAAGTTIIAATHDLYDIELQFDREIHLVDGECQERKTLEPLP